MPDDALLLHRRAHHEARHVGQEQQRHVEGVAELHEPGRLVGRVDEQHAALEQGVVGDDADRLAVQPGEADQHLARPQGVDLEQAAAAVLPAVDQRADEPAHVEGHPLVHRNPQVTLAGPGSGDRRRRALPVGR